MRRLGGIARDVVVPALFACWIAWLAYGAFAGAAGFRVLTDLQKRLIEQRSEVAELQARRAALAKRADLLNPKSLDPDMIDERIRAVLGYARDGDIVVPRSEIERLTAAKKGDQP